MDALYKGIRTARFVDRPNRFVVHMEMDGKIVTAHMPNPGRMGELLYQGTLLYAAPHQRAGTKTAWRIVGVEREGEVILLDTSRCNDVAAHLIDSGCIPGWEGCHVVRREVTMGDSRFDLLLTDGKETFPVEVKSCTLFGKRGAMFPDAVTARGRKHLIHLGKMGKEGRRAGLLILVHWDRADWFLPDYHTDPDFAAAFYEYAPFIDWKAAAVKWTADFTLPQSARLLSYPEEVLAKEMGNRGDYLAILHLPEEKDIIIGKKGLVHFPRGYYVYVGSAKKNLDQRMAHHRHLRKRKHWHMDYLRAEAEWVGILPVRTSFDLEHDLAQAVSSIADWTIPGFGCTDCACSSHLFGMKENPLHNRAFRKVEEDFRMNRLDELIEKDRSKGRPAAF